MPAKSSKTEIESKRSRKAKIAKNPVRKKVALSKKSCPNLPERTENFCRKYTSVILHLVPFFLLIQDIIIYALWRVHTA
jgi:hypothetical protein